MNSSFLFSAFTGANDPVIAGITAEQLAAKLTPFLATQAELDALAAEGKRQERYSGVSNASGLFNVTFAAPYAATPNIQANIVGGTTEQMTRIVSVSTTGFSVQAYQRATVLSLALSTATTNVVGATIHVLITEA